MTRASRVPPASRALTVAALRRWPLPHPAPGADKEARGHVWVIGGSPETPGAVVLAAEAALHAGAGKLTVVTVRSVAALVAIAIPEARVIGTAETSRGGLARAAAAPLDFHGADAVLIGSGMLDESSACEFARAVLPRLRTATVILDAGALGVARTRDGRRAARFAGPTVLTPHAGEMAYLCDATKETIAANPLPVAMRCAQACQATVVLKGATTFVAPANSRAWAHVGNNPGLAMSGSGDVLAGIVTGFAARGATPEVAAAWAVLAHARAGALLGRRVGPLGYLARELSTVLPEVLAGLRRGR